MVKMKTPYEIMYIIYVKRLKKILSKLTSLVKELLLFLWERSLLGEIKKNITKFIKDKLEEKGYKYDKKQVEKFYTSQFINPGFLTNILGLVKQAESKKKWRLSKDGFFIVEHYLMEQKSNGIVGKRIKFEAIQPEIEERFKNYINLKGKISMNAPELYEKLTKFLINSNEVTQLSRSPILIFGPRPYKFDKDHEPDPKCYKDFKPYELDNYYATLNLVDPPRGIERKFTCIIQSDLTIEEIKNEINKGNNIVEHILFRLRHFRKLLRKDGNENLIAMPFDDDFPYMFLHTPETTVIWRKGNGKKDEYKNLCEVIENLDFRKFIAEIIRNYRINDNFDPLIEKIENLKNQ